MINQSIRAKAFWLLDMIQGGPIKKHYNEISLINENKNTDISVDKRTHLIQKILKHASVTTPYYKNLNGFDSIESFPIIKKNTIQENFEDFKSKLYPNEPFFKASTSGSTGFPLTLYQDKNKRLRNTADTLYFLQKANFNLGEKFYDMQVWGTRVGMNKPFKSWKRNVVQVDVTQFGDLEIDKFLKTLSEEKLPINLYCIASGYENICKYLDKIKSKPIKHIKINSAIAISERLSSYTKKTMKEYFNINVLSRYSNEELGLMAQQLPNKNEDSFNFNWASYHIEILKMDCDKLVEAGEMGRIVVTDLFNYHMPIIRYDTGDIASYNSVPSNTNPLPTLKRIEGRVMNIIFDTSGKSISPFIIDYKFFDYFHALKQYQFIQTDKKEYLLRLITMSDSLNYEKELISALKTELGNDANIKINYVTEIPPLPSGKQQKIVNLYKKN